ncbi:putative isopentenyltransferase [Cavenderia fasciculata]|uniref:Isopentenyltransferase n=1 Tax=Cavenderia fasciculata TaxID=261658 RepID=F4Q2Z2_CACFS|nr:putative isopentenyltransferase [Cavenderia fasciculata]EGG17556.1 putative isopentenyltransferase [Cavenderia fasciculata]|eukprot:XP_004356040.1 putative isopentenyltransferase [Cavenderia fasciculata]
MLFNNITKYIKCNNGANTLNACFLKSVTTSSSSTTNNYRYNNVSNGCYSSTIVTSNNRIYNNNNNNRYYTSSRPKVMVIAGPTGIGKSRIGIEIAKQIGGEIISADSIQVYKNMLSVLREIDPESADSLTRNDYRRMAKSFYVYSQTGQKYSSFKKRDPGPAETLYDFRSFYVTTRRDFLMFLLNYRCEWMIQDGLVKEVVDLLLNGMSPSDAAARSIGYRQCVEALLTPMDTPISKDHATNFLNDFMSSTRAYSKRQAIWFRKCERTQWVNLSPLPEESLSIFNGGQDLSSWNPKSKNSVPTGWSPISPPSPTLSTVEHSSSSSSSSKQFNQTPEGFESAINTEESEALKTNSKQLLKVCKETKHEYLLFNQSTILPLAKLIRSGRQYIYEARPELFTPQLNPHLNGTATKKGDRMNQ